ncbi:hypothetical protein CAPTEDRAFT_215903, partial [Capitella teleta]
MEQRLPLLSMEVSQDAAEKLSAEHCYSSSKEPGSQKCTRGTRCYAYNCFNYNNREKPNKKTRICSVHLRVLASNKLKKNKRLTDSAVPALFDLPDHLQKTSQPRATATSKRAAEPLSLQCVALSADVGAAVSIIHTKATAPEPGWSMDHRFRFLYLKNRGGLVCPSAGVLKIATLTETFLRTQDNLPLLK